MLNAEINMKEEGYLCKFIKAQEETFLGKLVSSKVSNDTLIDQHSDKFL